RERRRVAHDVLAAGVGLAREGDERLRDVDPDRAMTAGVEVAADPALAAPELERPPAGLGQEREEGVAVAPVGVVVRRPRPRGPLARLLLEALPHGLTARTCRKSGSRSQRSVPGISRMRSIRKPASV